MPAYYEDYLKKQYPDEYHNPVEAFRKIDQTTDFPEMSRLLTELQNYRGDGIAAKLFYEGKVAEALSLVVEYQKKRPADIPPLSQAADPHQTGKAEDWSRHPRCQSPHKSAYRR